MNGKQIKTILFLISILFFSGCYSRNEPSSRPGTQSDGDIKLQTFRVSPAAADSAEPAIAAGRDGVFLLWVEHGADKGADLVMRQFDLNGQPKGEPVRVNPQPGQAKSWRGDPPTITIGQDGAVYVGWTAKLEGAKGAANILYLSVSRDGGRSFEPPVKVNDDSAPASHGMHSLAVDEAGRVYFAWLDERYLNSHTRQANVEENSQETYRFEKAAFFHHQQPAQKAEPEAEPNAELYFAVSTDGGKTFSPNKRLAENVCPCCKTSLLKAPGGGQLYVSWRQVLSGDFRHIAVTSSPDSGNSFSFPVIVSDDKWQITACPVSGASMTNLENGLEIAWFTAGEAGQRGLYLAGSKDDGRTFSSRFFISESAISGAPVLLSGGAAAERRIVWEDSGQIMTATLGRDNRFAGKKREIGSGELGSAAAGGEHLFIAYVKRENEKRGIWLSLINNPNHTGE